MSYVNSILFFEIPDKNKAIIYVKIDKSNEDEISCLVDSGANLPIWFAGEKLLKYNFPDAEKESYTTIISGLGQKPHIDVPIWRIPQFILMDKNGNHIIYNNLLVAVLEAEGYDFDLLISLTMLNRMYFSFSYDNSVLSGFLRIICKDKNYFIKPKFTYGYLDKIQVFYQDEL